eukprot:XP_011663678.1 PREDICTED: uncharacterized protein LOC578648 [Strongylocentrotus purpuratus]
MMNVFNVCKRATWLSLLSMVFLSVIIESSQAMTISRDELSQLFDGFLDKLEQWGDDPAKVEEITHQVEPHIVNETEENPAKVEEITRQAEPHIVNEAEETPAELSQKLLSILRELHEVESDMDTRRTPPPPALEQAKSADAVLIELLNESRRMTESLNDSDDDDHNEYEGEDQSTKSPASVITMSNPPAAEDLPNDNENETHLYDFAACELRLNERLEPLTLAKYHRFKGTVNLRQNRSSGSSDVTIRLFGLSPSNSNSQGHGVYIREFGDLGDGCQRLGPIFDTNSNPDQQIGSTGLLAVVSPDESGFVQSRTTEVGHFDLVGRNSIYGRSIVIEQNQDTYNAPLGCCVIGVTRDAEEWM